MALVEQGLYEVPDPSIDTMIRMGSEMGVHFANYAKRTAYCPEEGDVFDILDEDLDNCVAWCGGCGCRFDMND